MFEYFGYDALSLFDREANVWNVDPECRWSYMNEPQPTTFYFRKSSDAVHFKLLWDRYE